MPSTRVRVVNYGVTSVNSAQEVERLIFETSRGNIPSACIFLDGVNDVFQGVLYNNPDGVLFKTAEHYEKDLLRKLRKKVALLDILINAMTGQVRKKPSHLRDPAQVQALVRRTAEIYEHNIRRAKEICDKNGVMFFVFLQPNLYTIKGRHLNDYERQVLDRLDPAVQICFDAAYPLLQEKICLLGKDNIKAYDLTKIFDSNTEPIFLDACHVESRGNQIISSSISEILIPELTNRLAVD